MLSIPSITGSWDLLLMEKILHCENLISNRLKKIDVGKVFHNKYIASNFAPSDDRNIVWWCFYYIYKGGKHDGTR